MITLIPDVMVSISHTYLYKDETKTEELDHQKKWFMPSHVVAYYLIPIRLNILRDLFFHEEIVLVWWRISHYRRKLSEGNIFLSQITRFKSVLNYFSICS